MEAHRLLHATILALIAVAAPPAGAQLSFSPTSMCVDGTLTLEVAIGERDDIFLFASFDGDQGTLVVPGIEGVFRLEGAVYYLGKYRGPQTFPFMIPGNTPQTHVYCQGLVAPEGGGFVLSNVASVRIAQVPAGEETRSVGWSTGQGEATVHLWRQTLQPRATSFLGRRVTEWSPVRGTDGCWFPGSLFAPFVAVTGGTWDVVGSNAWGEDHVGWFEVPVVYYRNQGRAPCAAVVYQDMGIDCPPGGTLFRRYTNNVLRASIGATTVSSERDGQVATRTWP